MDRQMSHVTTFLTEVAEIARRIAPETVEAMCKEFVKLRERDGRLFNLVTATKEARTRGLKVLGIVIRVGEAVSENTPAVVSAFAGRIVTMFCKDATAKDVIPLTPRRAAS